MKNLIKLTTILTLLLIGTMSFSSCSSDGDDEDDVNYAAQVAGTYVGTGKATYLGLDAFTYNGMKLLITRSSNEFVLIKAIHSDNTTFLDNLSFQVTKTASGFILMDINDPSVRATIDKSGNITYTVPSIWIGNYSDPFEFNFSGHKE